MDDVLEKISAALAAAGVTAEADKDGEGNVRSLRLSFEGRSFVIRPDQFRKYDLRLVIDEYEAVAPEQSADRLALVLKQLDRQGF